MITSHGGQSCDRPPPGATPSASRSKGEQTCRQRLGSPPGNQRVQQVSAPPGRHFQKILLNRKIFSRMLCYMAESGRIRRCGPPLAFSCRPQTRQVARNAPGVAAAPVSHGFGFVYPGRCSAYRPRLSAVDENRTSSARVNCPRNKYLERKVKLSDGHSRTRFAKPMLPVVSFVLILEPEKSSLERFDPRAEVPCGCRQPWYGCRRQTNHALCQLSLLSV